MPGFRFYTRYCQPLTQVNQLGNLWIHKHVNGNQHLPIYLDLFLFGSSFHVWCMRYMTDLGQLFQLSLLRHLLPDLVALNALGSAAAVSGQWLLLLQLMEEATKMRLQCDAITGRFLVPTVVVEVTKCTCFTSFRIWKDKFHQVPIFQDIRQLLRQDVESTMSGLQKLQPLCNMG